VAQVPVCLVLVQLGRLGTLLLQLFGQPVCLWAVYQPTCRHEVVAASRLRRMLRHTARRQAARHRFPDLESLARLTLQLLKQVELVLLHAGIEDV
jgi:hypothetical protein